MPLTLYYQMVFRRKLGRSRSSCPWLGSVSLMIAQMRVWLLALLVVWALSHAAVFGDPGDPAS